jgi:hypothetical protein
MYFRATIALLCLLWVNPLHAQPKPVYDARTGRLQSLTKADLEPLEAHLQAGPVALVEFADTDGGELPAIHVATIVHAPAATLVGLIQKPEAYSKFMRTLDEVDVVDRKSDGVVYDWRWNIALLSLRGRNAMTWYLPPAERPEVGYRITIDSQSGDFGTGRISFRVLPRSDHESLLVISMRLDLRTANYVARKLALAAHSINRTANMALTYALSLGFRHEAERRVGYHTAPPSAGPQLKPEVNLRAVLPLLVRGDLVLLDMAGDAINQVATIGLIYNQRAIVRKVMLDTDSFGSALMPGSAAKVVSREGPLTTFDWTIDLPLVGVSGRMTMRDGDPVVTVDATDGALKGGRWNFETRAVNANATLTTVWASFDVRKSTWFVRALADADPYLGHGLTAASEVMLVRALRSHAAKLAALPTTAQR